MPRQLRELLGRYGQLDFLEKIFCPAERCVSMQSF
jgi:hypothetical protein